MDFYFVDERGNDSTNFETINNRGDLEKYSIASKYFQIGVLKLNKEKMVEIQNYINSARYFLNLNKEFEVIVNSKKPFTKLWENIEFISNEGHWIIFTSYIEKEYYNGPYLFEGFAHRFRIFNIYRNLSYVMQTYKTPNVHKSQIVIDRFSMKQKDELNAMQYLVNNLKKYYDEIEVVFIDSRCCDYLQLIDVIITVVDEKRLCGNSKFSNYNLDFINIKDFTN